MPNNIKTRMDQLIPPITEIIFDCVVSMSYSSRFHRSNSLASNLTLNNAGWLMWKPFK